MFDKILIANRGEIACRVIETARRMGIATVAVYSDADREALHVRMADEAIHIGAAPARNPYLLGSASWRRRSHRRPGHSPRLRLPVGERRVCPGLRGAGRGFHRPAHRRHRGDGLEIGGQAHHGSGRVPLVPGYHGDDQDPAMLGRRRGDGLPGAAQGHCRRRWQGHAPGLVGRRNSTTRWRRRNGVPGQLFGDDTMLVEKYLTKPVTSNYRCSATTPATASTWRERGLLGAAPSPESDRGGARPGMTEALRKQMGDTAVQAAQAIDYRGAGTVEFLLDEDGSFYFMEMNTRLQVEHPVTEMITGQDLVAVAVAGGGGTPLPLTQEQVQIRGHAFEARVYAEDPDNDFLPVTLAPPAAAEESLHVRGGHRACARGRGQRLLRPDDRQADRGMSPRSAPCSDWPPPGAYRIGGTVTNLDFLYNLATCQPVPGREAGYRLYRETRRADLPPAARDWQELPLAALALLLDTGAGRTANSCGPLALAGRQCLAPERTQPPPRHCHQRRPPGGGGAAGGSYIVRRRARCKLLGELNGDSLQLDVEGHRQRGTLARTDGFYLYLPGGACHFREVLPDIGEADAGANAGLAGPMNSTIVALLAAPGSTVEANTRCW